MTSRSCRRRRTRDPDDIDITWTLGPYRFELPLLASAMDGVVSPGHGRHRSASSAGSAVLNLEGIWTRYEDPDAELERIAELPKELATAEMQRIYSEPLERGPDRASGSARSRTRAWSPPPRSRRSGCASTTRPRSRRASTSS